MESPTLKTPLKQREHFRKYYARNKERINEKCRAYSRQYYSDPAVREAHLAKMREAYRQRKAQERAAHWSVPILHLIILK